MPPSVTAFEHTGRALRRQLREAILDHNAFDLPLRPCDLATCRATCCHDGAVLSNEEADTITGLLASHPETFAPLSSSDCNPVVTARHRTLHTATRPSHDHERADDFPSHFPRTRCVFLDPAHKCLLQLLSTSLGHHPWFFKPISCWMHPVLLEPAPTPSDRPLLTLRTPARDPARFASCTPCGRADPAGPPARESLRSELEALSALADRDLLAELHAPSL